MHLQTTLLISSSNCSLKTNHRSQMQNFGHPLKVIKKADNQMLQMMNKEDMQKLSEKMTLPASQNMTKKLMRFNSLNQCFVGQKTKSATLEPHSSAQLQQYFNQDKGILQHLFVYYFSSNVLKSQYQKNKSKCFILYGFSLTITNLQHFMISHPEIQLKIQIYKYDQHEYYQEFQIKSQLNQNLKDYPCKYTDVVQKLGEDQNLDCEEVTFVITCYDTYLQQVFNLQNITQTPRKKTIYFFPNINALKSVLQKRDQRTIQQTNRTINTPRNAPQVIKHPSPTSIRKSHQNYRILQVLQYYLKLECHSDHIMITNNQSRVIKEFLDFVYMEDIVNFNIVIDHQRKVWNKGNKPTAQSILFNKNNIFTTPSFQSKTITSQFMSEKQFISIEGQLIINDEFLSKLSEIKLPQVWLDDQQFRQQKKQMYKMKVQQHILLRQIRQSKSSFTQNIDYLNNLVGLPKISYQQITVQSLKQIKNSKIRQITKQLKQLINISTNLDIRSQKLKQKKLLFQKGKNNKNQQHIDSLSQLRKQITDIQKQLSLNKNHLNSMFHDVQNDKVMEKTIRTLGSSIVPTSNNSNRQMPLTIRTETAESFLNATGTIRHMDRRSSVLQAKYGAAIQILRKQKYDEVLKKQMTKAQFQAQKDYEQLKIDYSKAVKQLKLVLKDCD